MPGKKKTAVLLVNVGTPDDPTVKSVRRYLSQFLNDRRVIDIFWLVQKILVNIIIVPFRAPKSTKLYKLLWTKKGSPLVYITYGLAKKLQENTSDEHDFFVAMRYQSPDLKKVLEKIRKMGYEKIIIFSQFPQYASSTSGTIHEKVMQIVKGWYVIPGIEFVDQFYDHPAFIKAFAEKINSYNTEKFDHIIFSYHGLPLRQLDKVHPKIKCKDCNCDKEFPEYGKYCYRATCYETSRLIASQLKIEEDRYTVSFQSRLSNNWLEPFTDEVLVSLAKKGVKKVLIAAPSFVADCLETIVELGKEYGDLFIEEGRGTLQMVESLNDSDQWVQAVKNILQIS